uniref:Uncharacterized protein n=1 Tax=Rhizophora mucronata TaxID=61149 RepID=A0A2P2NDW5_RHIMU
MVSNISTVRISNSVVILIVIGQVQLVT